jgi:hypothetical protein
VGKVLFRLLYQFHGLLEFSQRRELAFDQWNVAVECWYRELVDLLTYITVQKGLTREINHVHLLGTDLFNIHGGTDHSTDVSRSSQALWLVSNWIDR